MGSGVTLLWLTVVLALLDTIVFNDASWRNEYNGCIFSLQFDSVNYSIERHVEIEEHSMKHEIVLEIVIQVISFFGQFQLRVAMFEFICSQSPHSMKGMFIGLSFALSGLFGLVSPLSALLDVLSWHAGIPLPCGTVYYITVAVLGLAAVAVYVVVIRRHKYRVRDEPCNVQRYVEEYYSKLPSRH